MAERPEQVDPALSAAGRHALHDEELVAAYAVDGEAADDPSRAKALIERCALCRDLHADLVAIGSTIRAAGTAASVAAVRPAPHDFRLTASDAVRLRGGNALQRWAARFIDGLAVFGRPVGASLAALGVVGLLVGTVALGQLGLAPLVGPTPGGAQGAPGPTVEMSGSEAGQSPTTDRTVAGVSASSRDDLSSKTTGVDSMSADGGTPWLLFAGSIALVLVGIGLLVGGTRRRRLAPVRRSTRT